MTEFTLGPKFKVGEVQVGDNVTFITEDAYLGTKTGMVARIIEDYSPTRKRIFLDKRSYVLNSYPDIVTDCYLNIPVTGTPEEKERKGAEKEAFENFLQIPVGSVFGVDLTGSIAHVWVKVGLNTWRMVDVEGSKYTSFEVYEYDDKGAFANIWQEDGRTTFSEDKDSGNWSQDYDG